MSRKTLFKHATSLSIMGCIVLALFFFVGKPLSSTQAAGESVQVWLTTADLNNRLTPQSNVTFATDSGSSPITLSVNENQLYQEMDGFGASFTDSASWLVYNKMSASQRNTLMNNLFSTSGDGIGLSVIRQPMGASDLSLPSSGQYSYNDMPAGQTDPTLANFSIAHDQAYIIPVTKQALQINPNLKIMASPWSPPGWMKTSDSMVGGTLKPDAYGPFANYFVKFIQAYQAEGIPVHAITVNNEALYSPTGYPGMYMTADEQRNFIKNNLGPALANNGLSGTKILTYDHNWDRADYPLAVLGDSAANPYVAGTAWHCYGGNVSAQTEVHNAYPDKETHHTECSGGEWEGSGNTFKNIMNLVIDTTRNWSKSVVRWGMVLDTENGPHLDGGCSQCRGVVTINQANGAITYNDDYYGMGHASKFITAGSYRIESSEGGDGVKNVAFKNPDGSKVVVAYNGASASRTFKVKWGNSSFSYTLPANSAATFKWSGTQSGNGGLDRTGWTATASSSPSDPCCSGDTPAKALDGNSSSRWSTGTGQASGQWFQVDMQSQKSFNQLTLDAGSSGGDYPRGYEVRVSNDGSNWGSVIASGNGSGQLVTINFSAQSARYIQVTQTGSAGNWWSIHEFNVYGDEEPGPSSPLSRTGWTAIASSSPSDPCCTGDTPAKALDGNSSSRWSTGTGQVSGQWFQVDMKAQKNFDTITLDAGSSAGDYPRSYEIYVSNDGSSWGNLVTTGTGNGQVVTISFSTQSARYITIQQKGSAGNWWAIHELLVYAP